MNTPDYILEDLKTDYRAGKLVKKCNACQRDIELYELTFDFGNDKICKDCYEDVGRHFREEQLTYAGKIKIAYMDGLISKKEMKKLLKNIKKLTKIYAKVTS